MTKDVVKILADVAAELEARGTELGPPADSATLLLLETLLGGELSATAWTLYSAFDGVAEEGIDDETMLRLWSIDAIIRNMDVDREIGTGQRIGDYFLNLDIIRCDLRQDKSQVYFESDGVNVAANLLEFCKKLSWKSFDF